MMNAIKTVAGVFGAYIEEHKHIDATCFVLSCVVSVLSDANGRGIAVGVAIAVVAILL